MEDEQFPICGTCPYFRIVPHQDAVSQEVRGGDCCVDPRARGSNYGHQACRFHPKMIALVEAMLAHSKVIERKK